MAMPPGTCPHCGSYVSDMAMHVELAVVTQDGDVKGALRHFIGECPKHGRVFAVHKLGHHSTLGEKELRKRYDKATRKRIARLLPAPERSKFNRAMVGKYKPAPAEIARWDRAKVEPVPSDIAMWLGRKG